MTYTFVFKTSSLQRIANVKNWLTPEEWLVLFSLTAAVVSTIYSYLNGYITSYGDAESHLNIAKRVIDSLTPGFAQLGGIWLPLPHILLVPFVYFDWLWRTGLAGAIVSGAAFVISTLFIYKLTLEITKVKWPAFFASLVFIFNPNILYLQSTPMSELILILFFVLSTYYFIKFLDDDKQLLMLLLAAFFGFCASMSRYDGWALVLVEAGILFLYYFPVTFSLGSSTPEVNSESYEEENEKSFGDYFALFEGRMILFSFMAFFGIALWLLWGYLILGDPLFFTHSQFSANSQQQNWLQRGELPAYHNIWMSFLYYFVTSMSTGGVLIFTASLLGMLVFLLDKQYKHRMLILLVLLVPFIFNIATLFLGQSVIFIPSITPITFEWTLFNVRYGVLMIPFIAIFAGFLFFKTKIVGRLILSGILILQCLLFLIGFSSVLSLQDGVSGLSSATAKIPDAQHWLETNYDYGIVLTDDYARTISIIRTSIKMADVIYIGNKPYWEESLVAPEKYARWIVMQQNDAVWQRIYDQPETNARLFKYFNKAYTSNEILIFRRIDDAQTF